MKKTFKILSFLVLALIVFCVGFPIQANETDSKSVLDIEVQGDGIITFTENENTYIIDSSQKHLQLEFNEATILHFQVHNAQNLETITRNEEVLDSIISNEKTYDFTYLFEESSKFVFTFKNHSSINQTGLIIDHENANQDLVLTDFEKKVQEDYKKGIKDIYLEDRKNIVEKINAYDYVDEDYFITNDYFNDYNTLAMLVYLNASILVDPTYDFSLKTDTMTMDLSNPVVNGFIQTPIFTWWESGIDLTWSYGQWKVDGNIGYCAKALWCPPKLNDRLLPAINQDSNLRLRKALYYGYQGPGDRVSYLGRDKAMGVTNELVSYAFSGESISMSYSQGNIVKTYSWIYDLPNPPAEFKVYTAEDPNYGYDSWGNYVRCQTLAFWKIEKGSLTIQKESSNTDITQGHSLYSLKDAQYGLYSDKDATKQIGTFTLDEKGASNIISELSYGTYYIKEIKAPEGYGLDETIYSVNIPSQNMVTLPLKDIPKHNPIDLLIKKKDANNDSAHDLSNAHFKVQFYDSYLTQDELENKSPLRTWIFKTDSNGLVKMNPDYLVSGDPLYQMDQKYVLPLGTITIQEIKAPIGYHINDTVFIQTIQSDQQNPILDIYQTQIILDQAIEFTIHKKQENSDIDIPNTEFVHTLPDGTQNKIHTDKQGKYILSHLVPGVHSLQEVKAAPGYKKDTTIIEFEVKDNGQIEILTDLTNLPIEFEINEDLNGSITVFNQVNDYSLKLKKINEHFKPLDHAEFTLYSDKECTQILDTQISQHGELTFTNLKDRTYYYFKETKAPEGYKIPVDDTGKPHIYTLYVKADPSQNRFLFTIDDLEFSQNSIDPSYPIQVIDDNHNYTIELTVTNHTGIKLPMTGSSQMMIVSFVLILGCAYLVIRLFKQIQNGGY